MNFQLESPEQIVEFLRQIKPCNMRLTLTQSLVVSSCLEAFDAQVMRLVHQDEDERNYLVHLKQITESYTSPKMLQNNDFSAFLHGVAEANGLTFAFVHKCFAELVSVIKNLHYIKSVFAIITKVSFIN